MTDQTEKARRDALSHHEQMIDAAAHCAPCKLCGGKAIISDAGTGCGYYIQCGNAQVFHASEGCLIEQRRLGGWAYNVMDWWNRLHGDDQPEGETPEKWEGPAYEYGVTWGRGSMTDHNDVGKLEAARQVYADYGEQKAKAAGTEVDKEWVLKVLAGEADGSHGVRIALAAINTCAAPPASDARPSGSEGEAVAWRDHDGGPCPLGDQVWPVIYDAGAMRGSLGYSHSIPWEYVRRFGLLSAAPPATPKADECPCPCHKGAGIMHIAPCCNPAINSGADEGVTQAAFKALTDKLKWLCHYDELWPLIDAYRLTSANPARTEALEDDWTAVYELRWIGAARPPVHPTPMKGRQTFKSFEKAAAFFDKQPDDAEFVSLTQIMTRKLDRTEDFRAAISQTKGG